MRFWVCFFVNHIIVLKAQSKEKIVRFILVKKKLFTNYTYNIFKESKNTKIYKEFRVIQKIMSSVS